MFWYKQVVMTPSIEERRKEKNPNKAKWVTTGEVFSFHCIYSCLTSTTNENEATSLGTFYTMVAGYCFSLIKNYKAKWSDKVWEESVALIYVILLPVSLSSTITKENPYLKTTRIEFCVALTPACWVTNKGYEYALLDFGKIPLWSRLPSNFLCSWRWPWIPNSLASIPCWDCKECTICLVSEALRFLVT